MSAKESGELQIADSRLQIGKLPIPHLQSLIPRPAWLALAVLAASGAALALTARELAAGQAQTLALGMVVLRFDGLSLLVAALALAMATLVVLFCGPDLAGRIGEEKLYALVVMLAGALTGLACAADLFNLWVWFELVAIASYLVVGFDGRRPAALEAGVKYLAQGAAGSTLVLLGIALVLAQSGTLGLDQIRARAAWSPALLAAGALFVVGFGVKAALVPLHTWLPDAYAQAPSGVSALLSAIVTKAGIVALLRALSALAGARVTWGALLLGFGALNIVAGNLLALRQTQLKRLLAYSSLGQIGYILLGLGVGVYAGQAAGAQGGLFHVLTHGLMSGLAFLAAGALIYATKDEGPRTKDQGPRIEGAVSSLVVRRSSETQDAPEGDITIEDLAGAAGRYPLAALALGVAALGLAGLPPLAGFMSKWQIFVAGAATRDAVIVGLIGFAALNTVVSLAYYAPLVNVLYRVTPSAAVQCGRPLPIAIQAPLAVLALAVLLLGVWPNLATWLTEPAARVVVAMFGG